MSKKEILSEVKEAIRKGYSDDNLDLASRLILEGLKEDIDKTVEVISQSYKGWDAEQIKAELVQRIYRDVANWSGR